MPGYQIGYGGVPAHQAAGGRLVEAPQAAGIPSNAIPYMGGAAWENEIVMCAHTVKKTGWPCENEALPDKDYCLGHSRVAQKPTQKDK